MILKEWVEGETDMMAIPRTDYPRPQFQRKEWLNLNGEWEFEFDDLRVGESEKWYLGSHLFSRKIIVPFAFQSKLSGVAEQSFHDVVWYRRKVDMPSSYAGKRILLHFGAVDYRAKVWVNGQLAALHEGGHTPFCADITNVLNDKENHITVCAEDFSQDLSLPVGKQHWEENSDSIWYTRTTGIWQSVWLEPVSTTHIQKIRMVPDIDADMIHIATHLKNGDHRAKIALRIQISFRGRVVSEDTYSMLDEVETRSIYLRDFNNHSLGRLWSPEKPNLYDIRLTLMENGHPVDEVESYFGMRKISVENGKLCLNNKPIQMRLVLDQGYFPDGNLTPPSDDAIRNDVELAKNLGFNGVRKHQKVEDPRYLYWCDRLGLVVWGEMANANTFNERYVNRITSEWLQVIERDFNHPCIVVWVPLNESWGVPNIQIDARQQHHSLTMYHLTKSVDPTRLVVSNDGWEHTKSDLCTLHDYEWRENVLKERYRSLEQLMQFMPSGRFIYAGRSAYGGEPILVTESGGVAFMKNKQNGWGYSEAASEEDFLQRLRAIVGSLHASHLIQGFCYTQLTDVEQEINGLLTYDRKAKTSIEKIRDIILNQSVER